MTATGNGTGQVERTAPLRIALVGTGRIGRMHAGLLRQRVEGAELVAVHDINHQRAVEAGAAFGAPVVERLGDLLAMEDVEAVGICAATDAHAELIVAAAEAGKAIFSEKPISLDLVEVDRALAAVEAAGVPFQVGLNRRFDPSHAAVREAVVAGQVGEPQLVRITSRDPMAPPLEYVVGSGGIFLDMTIHDFDMARFVTGSDVVEVSAFGARLIAPEYEQFDDWDTAMITLVHENGCLTGIDNSRQAIYGYDQRVEVFGSRGMAASQNPRLNTSAVQTQEGARLPQLSNFFLDRYTESFVREWEAFATAVRTGAPTAVTGLDARAPLVVGLAAIRSAREGRPVRVDELEAAAS